MKKHFFGKQFLIIDPYVLCTMPHEILDSIRVRAAYAPPNEVSQRLPVPPVSHAESDRDSGPRDPDSHSSVLKFSTEEHCDEEYNKLRMLTLKKVPTDEKL
jgi:hypothetical protein